MASSSSSSSSAAYEYEAPAPLQVPSSGIFRFGDRRPMDFSTESRAEFVARELTQPKSVAERVAEVAANNKSKLPFDDRGVYLTSDSRAHYQHWGEAYRPENRAKASTVGGGTTIVLGHNHPAETCAACRRAAADAAPGSAGYEVMNSQHRASFHKMPMPVELSKEERAAAIAVTRSGAAILKVFGKRPPESVSAMEAGNRHMLAAPPTHDVPGAGGDGTVGSVDGKERAKLVSIQLGYFETDHATEYRAHMVDYAAGLAAAASPYRSENRVHEVDPSKHAGKEGEDEGEAWKLRVVDDKTGEMKCEGGAQCASIALAARGASPSAPAPVPAPILHPRPRPCLTLPRSPVTHARRTDISKVKSAIDFGHDDYVVRSMYMDQTNCDKARLTTSGGWHRGTESFVPTIRPRYAANMKHPAVLAQKAAQEAAQAAAAAAAAAGAAAR